MFTVIPKRLPPASIAGMESFASQGMMGVLVEGDARDFGADISPDLSSFRWRPRPSSG